MVQTAGLGGGIILAKLHKNAEPGGLHPIGRRYRLTTCYAVGAG